LFVALLLAGNSQALVLYNNAVPPSIPPSGVMGLYGGWMGCVVINPNWIIVCNHEGGGQGTTVVVNGTTYVVAAMYYSGSYDLNLARITKQDGSNANLPVYADLSLDNSSLVGKPVVIGGFGYVRGALTANGGGYSWSSTGAGVLQWGTNIVTYNMYNYLYDSFQPYGSSKGTAYEAGLACGDSGGGWFYLNASTGRWTVAALNDGVTTNGATMFNPPDTNDAVGVPGVAAWIKGIISAWVPSTYTVTVNQTAGGAVSVSPSSATYSGGATATITALPAAGYLFTGWNFSGGSLSGNTGTDTLTVDGNVTLTANFTAETFTVTAATSTTWVYQNTPVVTTDRNAVALTISMTDTWGNNTYTATLTQTGPGVVTPTQDWDSGTTVPPTGTDPVVFVCPATPTGLSGYLVGGRVQGGGVVTSTENYAVTGLCTVTVTVVGDVSGAANPATAMVTVLVRPLGDINGDGSVTTADRNLLGGKLHGDTSTSVTGLDPEVWNLNGSDANGTVSTAQINILNGILHGVAIP
jgi:uncharacterized repeat protein (TIGR02543 family)